MHSTRWTSRFLLAPAQTCGLFLAVVLGCAGCSHLPHLVTLPTLHPAAVVIKAVRVFDGEKELSDPQDVVIAAGKILRLGPSGEVPVPEGAMVVSGKGRTLLPGLWDAHVHIGGGMGDAPWDARLPDPQRQLETLLYSGVTTAINAGHDANTEALEAKIVAGKLPGPHLVSFTRLVTKRGGHPVPLYKALAPWPLSIFAIRGGTRQLDDISEAAALVKKEFEHTGARFLKIVYNDIPPGSPKLSLAELKALIDASHKLGHQVGVHVGSPDEAVEAAEAGTDLLMHVPWTGELSDEQIARIAKTGIPLVTTRRIYGVLAQGLKGEFNFSDLERAVGDPKRVARLGAIPKGWGKAIFDDAYFAALPNWDVNLGNNVRRLHAAGVPMLAGTDSGLPGLYHGPALHRELEALVALGFSTEEVLAMATSKEADFFEPEGGRGRIRPGAVADLLLCSGNPLEWIVDTQHIAMVFKDGVPVGR